MKSVCFSRHKKSSLDKLYYKVCLSLITIRTHSCDRQSTCALYRHPPRHFRLSSAQTPRPTSEVLMKTYNAVEALEPRHSQQNVTYRNLPEFTGSCLSLRLCKHSWLFNSHDFVISVFSHILEFVVLVVVPLCLSYFLKQKLLEESCDIF